jgi:hypothetical protein
MYIYLTDISSVGSQSASGMTGFKIWNSCSFLVVLPVLFSLYPGK